MDEPRIYSPGDRVRVTFRSTRPPKPYKPEDTIDAIFVGGSTIFSKDIEGWGDCRNRTVGDLVISGRHFWTVSLSEIDPGAPVYKGRRHHRPINEAIRTGSLLRSKVTGEMLRVSGIRDDGPIASPIGTDNSTPIPWVRTDREFEEVPLPAAFEVAEMIERAVETHPTPAVIALAHHLGSEDIPTLLKRRPRDRASFVRALGLLDRFGGYPAETQPYDARTEHILLGERVVGDVTRVGDGWTATAYDKDQASPKMWAKGRVKGESAAFATKEDAATYVRTSAFLRWPEMAYREIKKKGGKPKVEHLDLKRGDSVTFVGKRGTFLEWTNPMKQLANVRELDGRVHVVPVRLISKEVPVRPPQKRVPMEETPVPDWHPRAAPAGGFVVGDWVIVRAWRPEDNRRPIVAPVRGIIDHRIIGMIERIIGDTAYVRFEPRRREFRGNEDLWFIPLCALVPTNLQPPL